ncbi:MAG TPA: L,D-transpeptidase/peptidoglycan binding protein [Solirubrobacterales bacterium]|nr:L,D-transpeptidase/peptidoglycan binding protein [Solirubrobacterales bacterium]
MGRKTQIAIAVSLALVLLAGGAVYAWDSVKKDEIAEGVTIGGVDVGGRTADEARTLVQADLIEPLDRPVTVTYGKDHFTLEPDELDIRADVDGMVQAALAASQEGGLPSRVWRYATGGEVDEDISPQIAYSHDTLDDFIKGVEQNVGQPAQDASIQPSATTLDPVPSQNGIEVQVDELRADLERAVQSPHSRTVEAEVHKVKPEVTTDELAAQYPHYIVIDRASFQLRYFENLKLVKTYTIAVGAIGYDTSAGLYSIQSKQVNPTWYVPNESWAGSLAGQTIPPGPDNPLVARWMGFNGGAGIHGTNDIGSLGSAASHGCIRMAVGDVIDLYDRVDVGDPVYIL